MQILISDISKPQQLALRAGNEKEEGETADTVGCCSLRVEHITLHEKLEGNECVVEFDFLGKDSIRYYNKVPVIKKVKRNNQHLFSINNTKISLNVIFENGVLFVTPVFKNCYL